MAALKLETGKIPNSSKKRQRILYLVNRKVLKEQLFEELKQVERKHMLSSDCSGIELSKQIRIETYQTVEQFVKGIFDQDRRLDLKEYYGDFQYIIFDKCHYFHSASLFNTNTEISFVALGDSYRQACRIFISATIEEMKDKFQKVKSQYAGDDEAADDAMEEIVKVKQTEHRILIATAVIDNGVSIKDDRLQNVIVLADNEETFIQILGRKRILESEKINLYIDKREKGYFEDRLHSIENLLEFYKSYSLRIENMQTLAYDETGMFSYPCYAWREFIHFHPLYYTFSQSSLINGILSKPSVYHMAKRLCYEAEGMIRFNNFSVERCKHLRKVYFDIIQDFDEALSPVLNKELVGKCRKQILNILGNFDRKKEGFLKELYQEESDYRKKFDNISKGFQKNDRGFVEENFRLIVMIAELPCQIIKEGRGEYRITIKE